MLNSELILFLLLQTLDHLNSLTVALDQLAQAGEKGLLGLAAPAIQERTIGRSLEALMAFWEDPPKRKGGRRKSFKPGAMPPDLKDKAMPARVAEDCRALAASIRACLSKVSGLKATNDYHQEVLDLMGYAQVVLAHGWAVYGHGVSGGTSGAAKGTSRIRSDRDKRVAELVSSLESQGWLKSTPEGDYRITRDHFKKGIAELKRNDKPESKRLKDNDENVRKYKKLVKEHLCKRDGREGIDLAWAQ